MVEKAILRVMLGLQARPLGEQSGEPITRDDLKGGELKRVLTGIQPSGDLHIGNYLGAILPAIELAQSADAFLFIADYHALTSSEPQVVRQGTLSIAATFIALGLDTDKHLLFRQSAVPQVCQLTWILSCQLPVGQLERGHSVKAARDAGREINAGTLFYPVLMSADILLYDSNVVPVGRDQKQHVEISRDLALKMNHRFGEGTLVVPEVSIRKEVGVIPGLDGRKMSKSYGNAIPLWAPEKKLRKMIMRIVTDSATMEQSKNPETCTVFQLYTLFADSSQIDALRDRYLAGGMGYGHAKQALFEVVNARLDAPRRRYNELMADPALIEEHLAKGAARARVAAEVTLGRVRRRVGLT